jgi:UDP-sugar pyrophosphorylase
MSHPSRFCSNCITFCFRRTINVEYNQLDPLLRASGHQHGDVNDSKTGFSPFPGNINQLLFELEGYSSALERTKGIMPEFVNPKYESYHKTVFKKPTRLECMMQDFPTVLEGDDANRVGFTSVAADLCFSPVKNSAADGVALQVNGTHPGTASTGEADQYHAYRKMMRSIGCKVDVGELQTFNGIKVTLTPAIVLKPSFVCFPGECKIKFPYPEKIKISARSTLIVRGNGVTIESLDLDGALIIDCAYGEKMTIKNKVIKNKGWEFVADETSEDEVIKMRGYKTVRKQTQIIEQKFDACDIL